MYSSFVCAYVRACVGMFMYIICKTDCIIQQSIAFNFLPVCYSSFYSMNYHMTLGTSPFSAPLVLSKFGFTVVIIASCFWDNTRNLISTKLNEYIYVFICCFLFYHTHVLNCHSDLWSTFSCLKRLTLWRIRNEVQVKVIYVILGVQQAFIAHWLLRVSTQLNSQQFYALPTLYLCVLYGSQNTQQLLHYATLTDWFL
jgi:hypothetical protein